MQKDLAKLVVICGPTASGKTELSLKLAKKYNGEIICADSRTIYQQMDIGTAKPQRDEKYNMKRDSYQKPILINNIPHYMIDIVKPNKEFTVAEFKQKALKIIKGIHQRNKLPFLVGGTGLYISAIINNLDIPKVPPDKRLRKKLEKDIERRGLNYLWKKLLKLDPDAASFVQEKNPRRIIRALEVCLKTKKPFSKLRKRGQKLFDVLEIGIKLPPKKLDQKIDQRVEGMIKTGLIRETKDLTKKYSPSLPSLNTIGYQEILSYLQNKITLKQATDLIKKNTRRYSRRQMTWFSAHGGSASGGKKNKTIQWIDSLKKAEELIKNFLA